MRFLFLLFIVMPIVEMLLLFEVAGHIGGLSTVGLVVLTAFVGINILKQQGFSTLTRANQRMQAGEMPAQEIMEGFCLAVGGALLLTPGFITDTVGFLLLIAPTRRALVKAIIKSGRFKMAGSASFQSFHFQQGAGTRNGPAADNEDGVFEGEFTREQPESKRLDPDSRD